jgi:GNAT superfamily N-acetyltransferase
LFNPDPLRAVHHPSREHIPAIGRVIASAMQNDPLHAYLFPDVRRFDSNRVLYEYIAHTEFSDLMVTSPACEGVAVWKRPGARTAILRDITVHMKESIRLATSLGVESISKLIRHHRWTSVIHREVMPDPHFYLRVIAVDPAHQHKGMGASLLRDLLTEADATGLSVYLETQNPSNIPMYEHFGFHQVRSERIPGTQIVHACMVRPGRVR